MATSTPAVPTGCGPSFTRPGTRDEYSACVAEELVGEGAYDFLLFSLPDNDFHSHRHGPEATLDSIAKADAMFTRIVEAGGGPGRLPLRARRAADRRSCPDRRRACAAARRRAGRGLGGAPAQHRSARRRRRSRSARPRARAPSTSSTAGRRHPGTHERARLRLRELAGVDLVTWLAADDGVPLLRTGVGLPDSRCRRGRGRAGRSRVPLPPRRPAPRPARQQLVRERRARGPGRRRHARPLRVTTNTPTPWLGSGRRSPRRMRGHPDLRGPRATSASTGAGSATSAGAATDRSAAATRSRPVIFVGCGPERSG